MHTLTRLVPALAAVLLLLSAAAPARAEDDARLKIKHADGRELVVFKHAGDRLKIEDGTRLLLFKAKPRESGGRKYQGPQGDTQVKVSDTDGGFKLKGERGELLWKIKRDGPRIRIADNEDNLRPDELRQTGPDKWAVEREDRPLGKVKHYPERDRIKVKDAGGRELYRSDGVPLSPLFAVLLVERIPRDQAYIIMAEMWLRGW
jgi:hypothetical protein